MYKIVEYAQHDRNGVSYELVHPDRLLKTADVNSEVTDFIKTLKPEEGKTYVLVNAMSAGEYYGSNRNGDYFPEQSLIDSHDSFVSNGHVYKHHINKDPKKALGKVLHSSYNPEMHRVELVLSVDLNEDENFVRQIQKGEYPSVSMGTRVPYDVCSICGHKSKTLAQYCDHLKTQMNQVLSDGRKVFALNTKPKFFDISFVKIPAERTAGMMRKIASDTSVVLSAELGEEYLKEAEENKEADINKRVSATVEEVSEDPKGLIHDSTPDMDRTKLKKMASQYSLDEIFSTFSGMRMMPKLADFQYLVLCKQGHEKLADALDRQNRNIVHIDENTKPIELENVKLSNFNDDLANDISDWIPSHSLTKPLVMSRVLAKVAQVNPNETAAAPELQAALGSVMEQEGLVNNKPPVVLDKEPSSVKKFLFGHTEEPLTNTFKNPAIAMTGLGGLYYGLHKMHGALGEKIGGADSFLMKRPWLIPLLIGAASLGTYGLHKSITKESMLKQARAFTLPNVLTRALVVTPATYLYAGSQEAKVRRGEPIGEVSNVIRKHPLLSSLVASWLAGKVLKPLSKFSSLNTAMSRCMMELPEEKFNTLYNDIISLN